MDNKIVFDFKDDVKAKEVKTVLVINTGILELLKAYGISYDILIKTYNSRGNLDNETLAIFSKLDKLSDIDKSIILKHEQKVFSDLGPIFSKYRLKFWAGILKAPNTCINNRSNYVINNVTEKDGVYIINIDECVDGESIINLIPEIFDKNNDLFPREFVMYTLRHFNEIKKLKDDDDR